MNAFFNQLFDYNFFCNKKLIETCIALDHVPKKSITLFSHVLNAHHIWNARMENKASTYDVFQTHAIENWKDIHDENQRNSFDIITQAEDFEKRINYISSEGRPYTNTLKDILFHIINHSTHHRGQIALDFRQNKHQPQSLDYISYKR